MSSIDIRWLYFLTSQAAKVLVVIIIIFTATVGDERGS